MHLLPLPLPLPPAPAVRCPVPTRRRGLRRAVGVVLWLVMAMLPALTALAAWDCARALGGSTTP